jgi:hypothetical protein
MGAGWNSCALEGEATRLLGRRIFSQLTTQPTEYPCPSMSRWAASECRDRGMRLPSVPPLELAQEPSVRPSAPHRYARLAVLAAWASPFASERLVPAVPRDSLHPLHALSTPVAVRSVIRHPADLSQENHTPLVSTTLEFLTTRLRRVHFRSSLGCSPARVVLALFLQRSPPWLFTTAAWGGLRPAPVSRSRGAFPHLSRSLTYSHG